MTWKSYKKAWSALTANQKKIYINYGGHDNAKAYADSFELIIGTRNWEKKRLTSGKEETTLEDMVPFAATLQRDGGLTLKPGMGWFQTFDREPTEKQMKAWINATNKKFSVRDINDIDIEISSTDTAAIDAFKRGDLAWFKKNTFR